MKKKFIHYCWFGNNPKSELIEKCIDSWKKYCPDYEIKEWNESNFDFHCCRYVEEAYAMKKWAFVSDYCRFWVLFHYGGIYLDTDVEIIKPLDDLPTTFVGYEEKAIVNSGLIRGAEVNDAICQRMIDSYSNDRFVKEDGSLNLQTVCHRETNILKEYGLKCDNTLQVVAKTTVFPKDWFAPKDYYTEKLKITKNTYTIHHYLKSWTGGETKKERFLRRHPKINAFIHIPNKVLKFLLGEKNYKKIKKVFGR
jgi:hypothetical protein